jgi:2-C-methyl-D-erythritol 2,4-cyclodiphosphate synthase
LRIKIGIGYDIHKLTKKRPFFLGGIKIPSPKGLLGHSDGDCLVHAVIDALLGALGEKDIGQFFPNTDPIYKDARSTELLKEIVSLARKRRMKIVNIDSIIFAEEPHLGDQIPRMKEALCSILEIKKENFGIKAKTHEGLGEIGRGEAVAASAVILIKETGLDNS